MKTVIISLITLIGITIGAGAVRAANYAAGDGKPILVGICALVDTKSQEDSTHVYTTNPDYVQRIGVLYVRYFFRNPRCDELQFQIDHNNSLAKIEAWLSSRVAARLASGYYNGQTISTDKHEWFLMENSQAHRIPDWLTALSNGLLIDDRLSFYNGMTTTFYANAKIGQPVQFNDGTYATTIVSIWKNSDRDYSALPTRMATEINTLADSLSVFTTCTDMGIPGQLFSTGHGCCIIQAVH